MLASINDVYGGSGYRTMSVLQNHKLFYCSCPEFGNWIPMDDKWKHGIQNFYVTFCWADKSRQKCKKRIYFL